MKWRFINTQSSSAAYNMAVDEFLFEQYKTTRVPVLRLYRWEKPCVSLGRNQKKEQVLNLVNCETDKIEVVVRPTGGQAIYHIPQELSYSLVASIDDLQASVKIKDSYQKICSLLISVYSKLGLNANFARNCDNRQIRTTNTNLCFASWEADDIIVAGRKIGGNAQRRARNVLLQHGSIPLVFNAKEAAKYIVSIPFDISHRTVALNELLAEPINQQCLENLFLEVLNQKFDFEYSQLTKEEKDIIDRRVYETRVA